MTPHKPVPTSVTATCSRFSHLFYDVLWQVGTGGDEKPGRTAEEVKAFDSEFVKVDQGTLFELILVRTHLMRTGLRVVKNTGHCRSREFFM